MKEEHYNWLNEPNHKLFMYSSQFINKEDKRYLYEIYNDLTGENKRPNSCGRCVTNTLKMIKHHYELYTKIQ
jgi:hypothetical protein